MNNIIITVSDDFRTLGKHMTFSLDNQKYTYFLSRETISFLNPNIQHRTATSAIVGTKIKYDIIKHIIQFVYKAFMIHEGDYPNLVSDLLYEIDKISTIKISNTVSESILDNDIQDAINISKKAMKYSKEIAHMLNEIKADKNNYYNKYG